MEKSKECTNCKVEKSLDDFHNNKLGRLGKGSRCKLCARLKAKEWREENPKRFSEAKKKCYLRKREQYLERDRENQQKNKDRYYARQKRWREENKDHVKLRASNYQKNNKEVTKRISEKRSKALKERTPAWSDIETINLYKQTRASLSKATGLDYQVDHIIPLQGDTVSGLHVPENLQIITARKNRGKHLKYSQDQ